MQASLDWLSSYLDRPIDAPEAERLLTAAGFPIDGTETIGSDTALEVEVTSNRGDCLSHVGLAREIAAASGRSLQPPSLALPGESQPLAAQQVKVTVAEPALCPVYTARVIRGVKVGPSPDWLVRRLESAGLRSVNNVVDITNFVLLELGQPLHAFDLARLQGNEVHVRRAAEGESFTAIDGSKHKLRSDMLVIADASKPVAIAGVMGGLESEVTASTTAILLESAIFAPLSVRSTSRALKLSSDSSYRFERGRDPRGVEEASRRAAALIIELAGGQLAQGVVRVGNDPPPLRELSLRLARVNSLLGITLQAEQVMDLLERLELSPRWDAASQTFRCTVPSFRLDLEREVDLIEEIARLHGYQHIPVHERIEIIARPVQNDVKAAQRMRRVLAAHGYFETITFSFVNPRQGKPFLQASEQPLLIEDERRSREPMLRPSLLPSLLACRKVNQDAGNAGVQLYEAASTWVRSSKGQIIERRRLALLTDLKPDADTTLRALRGTVQELVQQLAGNVKVEVTPADSSLYAAAGRVLLEGEELGTLGIVTPAVQQLFDLQHAVGLAELELPLLLKRFPPGRTLAALPRFPAIERDLSIVVDEAVRWSDVDAQVRKVQPQLLEDLRFLGVYRGKPIAKGSKSVSFRMLFRDAQATLRHEQVDPQVASVVEALKKNLRAELRA